MPKIKLPSLPVPKFFEYEFVKRGLRYGTYFGAGMIVLAFVIPYFPDQIRFFDFAEGKKWLLLLILGFIAASLRALAEFGVPMACDEWCLPTTLGGAAVTLAALAAECIIVGFFVEFVVWTFWKIVKMRSR